MSSYKIAILGAGVSGMAAAKALNDLDCTIYESRSHSGGHASSFQTENGFIFDEGPHVSFTADRRIQDFLAQSVGGRFFEHPIHATNYFHGHVLKHPVQCNLFGLPSELVVRCIADLVRAQHTEEASPLTYKDWCYRNLGATISETFTRPYTRKYWNRELEQLTTDWVSGRIYAPQLEEVLSGALSKQTGEHHYASGFRYPETGGFGAYNSRLAEDAPIQFGRKAVEIDLAAKKISFANGESAHFDHLISTLPLPELVQCCNDAPLRVREAGRKLACTSHFILSVGIARPRVGDASWTYYYDEDIPFSRASFPSQYSPNTAPSNCSSVQVEVVHSRSKPVSSKDILIERCIAAMLKVGLLRSREEIIALDARDLPYANVIFDFDRAPNTAIVHDFLRSNGVHWAGRYGEWAYLWTDQSMLSGERTANEVRSALGLAPRQFDAGI